MREIILTFCYFCPIAKVEAPITNKITKFASVSEERYIAETHFSLP